MHFDIQTLTLSLPKPGKKCRQSKYITLKIWKIRNLKHRNMVRKWKKQGQYSYILNHILALILINS